jgi:hypothetical protein
MTKEDWANALDTSSKMNIFVPIFGDFDKRYHNNPYELLDSMWSKAYEAGVLQGKKDKAKEIRECLNMKNG